MTQTTHQNYILGAGAVGHLLGCLYAQAGIECELITRDTKSLSNKAVTFIDAENQTTELSLDYNLAKDVTQIEQLLVTVKSHQLEQALLSVKHALQPSSQIMLLSNGMGNLETAMACLEGVIKPTQIWPGINTHGSFLEITRGKLILRHTGIGTIHFGSNYLCEESEASAFTLPPALHATQIEGIETNLWLKLAINAVINPLTALHGCRNGELLQNPQLSRQVITLTDEINELYTRLSIKLDGEEVKQAVTQVITATANNYSSMQRDVFNKKPSEIEAITGFLLKYAQSMQFPMQEHQYLYQQIKNIEQDHKLPDL